MTSRGEFRRLADLASHLAGTGPGIPVGVGDDAAVVEVAGTPVVVCTDVLVEGVHFTTDVSAPADVGWKALAVNVSDIAAMGGISTAAVVGLLRPPDLPEAVLDGFYAGMAEAGLRWDVPVVGGDTVTAPVWAVAVTVIGATDGPVVTRGGATPGDRVVLVGRIGAAAAALRLLAADQDVPPDLLAAHRRPTALPASGRALARSGATAMIDLSDGLGADAGHVARASGVDLRLDRTAVHRAVADGVADLVPAHLLDDVTIGGGEDFALLATVPPDAVDRVEEALATAGEASWQWIGVASAGPGEVWVEGAGDARRRVDGLGYDHG